MRTLKVVIFFSFLSLAFLIPANVNTLAEAKNNLIKAINHRPSDSSPSPSGSAQPLAAGAIHVKAGEVVSLVCDEGKARIGRNRTSAVFTCRINGQGKNAHDDEDDATPTPTTNASASVSPTPSGTPTVTPTPSVTPTVTPTATAVPTQTPSTTPSASPTYSASPTPTATPGI